MNDAGQEKIHDIEDKISRTAEQYGMLNGGMVVVGLSGGADSVSLAHYLNSRYVPNGGRLIAAHVNHGLRGAESDADENFVREWCEKNGVPLQVLHADIRAQAQSEGKGLEECGRDVRYAFFHQLASGENDRIATAHTLSDCAETVLLNLARGTGAKGLCGIPPVRGKIIRPLISLTREEIEQYCQYYNLSYVTDSTNLSREYARNKIRLDVVPVLKEVNPAFESAVLRTTRQFMQDQDCLTELAEQGLKAAILPQGYSTEVFRQMHPAVRARAIILAVNGYANVCLNDGHIQAVSDMICAGQGKATVAGNVRFSVEGDVFFISAGKTEKKLWMTPLKLPETLTDDGRTVIIKIIAYPEYQNQQKINNLLFNNAVDYDTITNNLYFRCRKEGDTFAPAGRGVTKRLKKLFSEAKIPPSLRNDILILESGGHIAWIEGFGPSQDCCVKSSTKNVALIHTKESKTC